MNTTTESKDEQHEFPHDLNEGAPFGGEWVSAGFQTRLGLGGEEFVENTECMRTVGTSEVRGYWGIYHRHYCDGREVRLIHLPTGMSAGTLKDQPGANEELRGLAAILDPALDADGTIDLEEAEKRKDAWREQRKGGEV